MSRKQKTRKKQQAYQHIMVRLDGDQGEHGGLEPDCPICAMLAASGQGMHVYNPATMAFTEERVAPMGPVKTITLTGDAAVAPHLDESPMELDMPKGMLVGEFLFAVRFVVPELAKAFPEGALELQVDGHPLGWAAPVPPVVTLAVAGRRAMS